MPLSALASVILRMFACYWILIGVTGGVAALIRYINHAPGSSFELVFAGMIAPLLIGVSTWFFAPALAHRMTKGHETGISLQGVTREDLYAVTILGIGLYLATTSLGRTFNWIHYFALKYDPSDDYLFRTPASYYDLTEPLITFVAGTGLALSAKVWARKLA